MSLRSLSLLPLVAALVISMGAVSTGHARSRTKKLKVATLAPEGSTWWQIIKDADKRIRELTNNSVKIQLYAGGVAGDEPDVVRKMRMGQLHGAALTSVGLGEIQSELLVLQAPGVIQSWAELDAAREAMGETLKKLLRDKGYEVLVWGDVGFTRVFTKGAVRTPAAFSAMKPWCWTQDGVWRAFYNELGVKPVMSSIPEVLPGLQTGLMDSYSTAPLVSLSLQWYTRSTHMLDLPLNVMIGAIVLSSKEFNKLSDSEKAAIEQAGRELTPKMKRLVRADNQKAIEAIERSGVTIITPTAVEKQAWFKAAVAAAHRASGHVYSPELLKQLQTAVDKHRATVK